MIEFARVVGLVQCKNNNLLRWGPEPLCFAYYCYIVATPLNCVQYCEYIS
jgi:hypothetical protein